MNNKFSLFDKPPRNAAPAPRFLGLSNAFTRGLLYLLCMLLCGVIIYVTLRPDQVLQYDARQQSLDLTTLNETDRLTVINEYRKTAIQLLGGLVISFGLYFIWRRIQATEKTLFVTERGQITDRFSKAIEQLGDDRLAMKLGGIFALERIARDSREDHGTVMEVLTAFVRNHQPTAPPAGSATSPQVTPAGGTALATEVQTAVAVIARRNVAWDHAERKIDLAGANLAGASLIDAQLPGAILANATLTKAHLSRANLTAAKLDGAQLSGATLTSTNLEEAELRETNLQGAQLKLTRLAGAFLRGAHLENAVLWKARLNKAILYHAVLNGADLSSAELREAKLKAAEVKNAALMGVNLWNADLTKTVLRGTNLAKANLVDAQLIETDLQDTILCYAKFIRARFQNTLLTNADLTGADLRGATGLTVEALRSAKNYREARFDAEQKRAFAVLFETEEEGRR